jgi:hypothetical protein
MRAARDRRALRGNPAHGVPVATALPERGARGLQEAAQRTATADQPAHGTGGGNGDHAPAQARHPLERAAFCQGGRPQLHDRASDLAEVWAATATNAVSFLEPAILSQCDRFVGRACHSLRLRFSAAELAERENIRSFYGSRSIRLTSLASRGFVCLQCTPHTRIV